MLNNTNKKSPFGKVTALVFLSFTVLLGACDGDIEEMISSATNGDSEAEAESASESDEQLDGLDVHFIDVDQGDAILLQTEDGTNVLVDAGDWTGDEVVPYLEEQGVEDIDLFIGSHEHADHIGQADDVLNRFTVNEVWLPGNEHTSQTYTDMMDTIDEQNIDYSEPRAGEGHDVDDMHIDLYSPKEEEMTGDYNNDSLVTKVTYEDISFMLTGDAEEEAEANMLSHDYDLEADILKAGHHGSNTSSTEAFVEAVDPDVAVVSYGLDNSYYHPHQVTIDTYDALDIDLYGTGANGDIVISTDGEDYHVDTEKDEEIEKGGD